MRLLTKNNTEPNRMEQNRNEGRSFTIGTPVGAAKLFGKFPMRL